ncbi:MAG: D-alanyl-D-alanine carboxypeptidase/D-alanyl-D-alanine-endopeptidase, partial [Bacteroidales bacterium]|nr:D-alanyl-D-alanine carboxypeptidase/D-alanyl-D-alanine-endopeptidase [Bacteroidales bacterium]
MKSLCFLTRTLFVVALSTAAASAQQNSINKLLNDSSMLNGSISFCAINAVSGEVLFESGSAKSLIPASILKLVTTAAALELLGPDYRFRTSIGYSGRLTRNSGRLTGDIVISGGGDPAFASKRFQDHYGDIKTNWADAIMNAGIRKVEGRVITDDSHFDFLPVPAKWLWEDAGNYYGAGAYGLSVFDNTYDIYLKRSTAGSSLEIAYIDPPECRSEFSNWLVAAGTADEGYVFAAPYSTNGWLAGTVPENLDDFSLKASISDPPRLFATMIEETLREKGISIESEASTSRLELSPVSGPLTPVAEILSPPLSQLAEALNHESINLYAEHFLKELGKKFRGKGSTEAGIDVIYEFLRNSGISIKGMFIEDGSGLSPMNSVNAAAMTRLLVYMKNSSGNFAEFYNSLPEAGKEGTLRNYFRDPVFESRLFAKSGSMTRVRSYSGYLQTLKGNTIAFTIIVNNYSGPSRTLIVA